MCQVLACALVCCACLLGQVCALKSVMMTCRTMCAGTRNVPVVKTCKCVGGCHRLPHYEEVRMDGGQDVRPRGDGGEEGGSGEVTGQGEELEVPLALTVIDVGRCSSWTCPIPKPQCIP